MPSESQMTTKRDDPCSRCTRLMTLLIYMINDFNWDLKDMEIKCTRCGLEIDISVVPEKE